jgi:uncharacterized protein YndB with AHSA1/START domain
MGKGNDSTNSLTDREIVSTRIFNSSRHLVFKAWKDPKHLAKWWGPKGFTNTFHEFQMKAGRHWKFIMHGPDGINYKNESIFVEVIEPERIVLDHITAPKFRLVATFEDQSGKTKLTFRQIFNSPAVYGKFKAIAVEGNEQNLTGLRKNLKKCYPE